MSEYIEGSYLCITDTITILFLVYIAQISNATPSGPIPHNMAKTFDGPTNLE